jgi:four helix bundle protein
MIETGKKFDLEIRTAKFGTDVILFCRSIKSDDITRPLIIQFIRSSTSIGANYMEANGACSKKDFKNKIYICKKEVQESKHWLNMIAVACPEKADEAKRLWQEAQELTLIFGKIVSTLKKDSL